MQHISMSRFGRGAVPAGQTAAEPAPHRPAPSCPIDKWSLAKAAVEARVHLGVSDRDLTVLSALLSFHPETELGEASQLTVFPSNASLSSRLHGMPESTLRRHLATLVKARLITRRDSPNGKRFARRTQGGQIDRAFGFDLRPLLIRAAEIFTAAEHARAKAAEMRRVREEISLNLRDCARIRALLATYEGELPDHAEQFAAIQRHVRRKLPLCELQDLCHRTRHALQELSDLLPPQPDDLSGTDSQNERHYQKTEKENFESEDAEKTRAIAAAPGNLTLDLVLTAAPDVVAYSQQPIRNWRDLLDVSAFIAPMLGITRQVWTEARSRMGDDAASVAVACILQQVTRIRQPGAYLRVLARKAASTGFTPSAMVEGLLRERYTAGGS